MGLVAGLYFLAGAAVCAVLQALARAVARRRAGGPEPRFRALFERCPDALVALDPRTGRIVHANARARGQIGCDGDALSRRTVADLIVPEELPETMRHFADLACGRTGTWRSERRVVCQDGRCVVTDCSVAALSGASGEIELLIACLSDITDRKRVEAALEDSERKLRNLFELSPLGIVLNDFEGHYLEFNRAFETISGYSAAELRAMPRGSFTPSEYHAEEERLIESMLNSGRYGPYEKHYRRKDGTLVPVRLNGMLITGRDGRSCVWSIVEDISADRRAQEALRLESVKNLALLRNASDGIHILDTAGNVIDASDSFCEMLGRSRERIIGMNVQEWDAHFTSEELTAMLRKDFANPGRRVFETRHRRGDGSVYEAEISSVAVRLGEVPVMFNSARDITERKRTEERLRESELRLRVLIEQSPMGISFSRAGITLDANAHYLKMFGYASVAEVRGTPILLRIAPNQRARMQEYIERRRAGLPASTVYETVGLRKDGSEMPLFVSAKRIELADGPMNVSFLQDFTERKASEARIRHLAFYDQLTQLPNRALLEERLQEALAASARSGRYGALLLLNLDNFKSVNDARGHAAGDALLQQVASRLAAAVREGDTLARLDGDQFVVLLQELGPHPVTSAGEAKAFGLKMMQALSGAYALPEGEIHIGCSVGAALLSGYQQTIEDVIRQVNVALHQAKQADRNALRFFDPRMQESVNARVALEGELRKALTAGQFLLHYQVQVDYAGRCIGAEALLRWNHPQRGVVAPGEFIGLAEETHLILPIGQWVIDTACAQLAAWSHQASARELVISVNVSPLQFQQPDFAEQVLGSIRRHGVPAHRLELELTETLLQGDLERTVDTMKALKAHGVRFSLDDFGTGYSSLQYLRQLPLHQVKIDRSFVQDIADPNGRAIVGAILAMSRHLNLEVIAEGVETEDQLAVLRGCGCTRYQGYLFGRPVPVERLLEDPEALAVG